MRLVRWTSLVAAVAIAAVGSAGVAEAQNNICVDLQARLIQIERGNSGGDRDGYAVPINQQRSEINRATAEARRAGCTGGFFLFQRRPEAKCAKLMATIDNMQNNLQRLMSRGRSAEDPWTLANERSDVLRALAYNRCGATFASNEGYQPPPRGGLFASLFGTARLRTFGDGDFAYGGSMGTYRTLCVRTCDGFYFPISFSTVPGQFPADAETCRAMCPGAEAVLFTHRNPGEDADQMVSLAGEPYSSLPTAFKYRQEYDKSCTCHSGTAAVGDGFADFGTQPADGVPAIITTINVPLPHPSPIPGEDPETVANRAGKFVLTPVKPRAEETEVAGVSADGHKIRVVGPAYYYAQ